jgi:hypothetical protein
MSTLPWKNGTAFTERGSEVLLPNSEGINLLTPAAMAASMILICDGKAWLATLETIAS